MIGSAASSKPDMALFVGQEFVNRGGVEVALNDGSVFVMDEYDIVQPIEGGFVEGISKPGWRFLRFRKVSSTRAVQRALKRVQEKEPSELDRADVVGVVEAVSPDNS